jgi:hypothetical protein
MLKAGVEGKEIKAIVIDPLLLALPSSAHPPLAVILRSEATKDLLLARA